MSFRSRTAPSLAPLRRASMPRFPGFAAALGPAGVWMALAQGSGELIWWPHLVAKYGLGFLFLLIPACLLQLPLNREIGRYTVLTGETLYQGFTRLGRPYAVLVWVLLTASFLWFGAFASAGGTALGALTGFPAGWSDGARSLFWGYATIALFLAALVLSPIIYRTVELFMWAVALTTVAGLLLACTHPAATAALPEFAKALVVPPGLARPWDPADAEKVLTAVTFAGLGGFWTTFYSYWLREKGCGMAARMGHLTGVLGRKEKLLDAGFAPAGGAATVREGRRWLGFLWVDAGMGVLGNLATTLMMALLAYALLFPQGLIPEGHRIAVVQAEFFRASWGPAGAALFWIVAAAFLADTWMATVDAVARVQKDLTYHLVPGAKRYSQRWWYFLFLGVFTLVTGVTMALAAPGPLILTSAVIGFVGTVVYTLGLYRLNYAYLAPKLPAALRPAPVDRALFLLVIGCYLVLALGYLWVRFWG